MEKPGLVNQFRLVKIIFQLLLDSNNYGWIFGGDGVIYVIQTMVEQIGLPQSIVALRHIYFQDIYRQIMAGAVCGNTAWCFFSKILMVA